MNKKLKYIILFIIWVLLFSLVTTLVCLDKVSSFDNKIYDIVFYFNGDFITLIYKLFSAIGSTSCVLLLVILNIIINKNKKRAFYEDISVLVTYIFNYTIKSLVARSRPVDINLVNANNYSYPSGHTMVNYVIYGVFIYIIWHNDKLSKKKKYLYISSICILHFLIAISRIYLGAHYASDVLGGFLAGNVVLVAYIAIFKNKLLEK